MILSVAAPEECCAWCRQPVARCTDSSCDSSPTYAGVLRRGEWRECGAPLGPSAVAPGALETADAPDAAPTASPEWMPADFPTEPDFRTTGPTAASSQ